MKDFEQFAFKRSIMPAGLETLLWGLEGGIRHWLASVEAAKVGCDGSWSIVGTATEGVGLQMYFEVKKWQDMLMDRKDMENERNQGTGSWGRYGGGGE